MYKRNCPICGSVQASLLHEIDHLPPTDQYLKTHQTILCCGECNMVYVDVGHDLEACEKYYSSFYIYDKFNPKYHPKTSVRFNHIKTFIPNKNACILDIGCGDGELLRYFNDKGYSNILGSDVYPLKSAAIPRLVSSIYDLPRTLEGKKFDVLILSHVLEHLYEINNLKPIFLDLLNDQGIIYIEVPNTAKYHLYNRDPYFYWQLQHINHFDVESLTNYLKDSFNIESVSQFNIPEDDLSNYPVIGVIGMKDIRLTTVEVIKKFVKESEKAAPVWYEDVKKLDSENKSIVVWGAGDYLYRLYAHKLQHISIDAIVDNDPKKQNTTIYGISIDKPEKIMGYDVVLIASCVHAEAIKEDIVAMGFKGTVIQLTT